MPTPLHRIEIVPAPDGSALWHDKATGQAPVPGDTFYAPHLFDEHEERGSLSSHYWIDWQATQRPPIVVVLPTGQWWCVDERSYTERTGYTGDGWKVTGSIDTEPVTLTAAPSIKAGRYHGVLTEGVLTPGVDDLSPDPNDA